MKTINPRFLLSAAFLASSSCALADYVDSGPILERERLTGDWGGSRTSLENAGITPFFYYDAIVGANVSGGIQDDEEFTGQIYAGLDLDLEKLFDWEATTMKISMVNRHGDSVSKSVGGIYDPMTIYGGPDGQETILYQIAIDTYINDQLSLKFGRDSQDSDFANDDLYRYSLSTSINGPIRAMMLNEIQIVSFPLAVWHARIKYEVNDEHMFKFGAYQNNENIWENIPGTDFGIDSDDGITYMAQYDWTPMINDRPAQLYVGVAHTELDYTDFKGESANSLSRLYAHFDFQPNENLTLFAFGAYTSQEELAQTPLQVSAGANYKGLIPGRDEDRTVAFVTYAELSDDYGDSIGEDLDYEMVFELGHRVQLTPAFYIQPSVQYIKNPGGTGDIDDAVVVGAWLGMSF
ncbi:carbohydrate porin [Coraliomargarita sp. SDUM461004]|uniref:Carbohydrate porin n=1 Tax=Thalassobacterium sedimentorum TaxID=3041258 RepID=A0ABU1ADR1_9BACT|nr:carbohydrate porin [Coraliomargarita sp. SDUM461004]MDQ8192837.1 carbohydrate porin [Coraliomargarita sp. SDUM461004]